MWYHHYANIREGIPTKKNGYNVTSWLWPFGTTVVYVIYHWSKPSLYMTVVAKHSNFSQISKVRTQQWTEFFSYILFTIKQIRVSFPSKLLQTRCFTKPETSNLTMILSFLIFDIMHSVHCNIYLYPLFCAYSSRYYAGCLILLFPLKFIVVLWIK
jgi:hypothetical protein